VATKVLICYRLSRSDAQYGAALLERLCVEYTDMSAYLTQCFHYAMHIAEMIEQYGLLNNTGVWSFKSAHLTLTCANKNRHQNGVVERAMMRKWLKMQPFQSLVSD
jgi:hypothetical protein